MKPISIMNKLTESSQFEELKNLPDWIIDELLDDNDVTAWYCSECDEYYDEPHSERTNMEDYYGVGNSFSNSSYEDLVMCPKCKGGLREEHISVDDVLETFLVDPDLYEKVYAKIPPENLAAYYANEGTHHSDYLSDHPDEAWDIVKEMISEGILK